MYVFGRGCVREEGESGGEDWIWVLLNLWEQGEYWTCVCVWVEVVWVVWVVGRGVGPRSVGVGWCYVCVRC